MTSAKQPPSSAGGRNAAAPPPGDRPHLQVSIVTGDRVAYDGPADAVTADGIEGAIAILLHHAPMLTMLEAGEMLVRWGDDEVHLAVGGGFLEVVDDTVTVLADSAERPEEIDIPAAEEARRRAEALMKRYRNRPEAAASALALRQSRVRLRLARRAQSRRLP